MNRIDDLTSGFFCRKKGEHFHSFGWRTYYGLGTAPKYQN